MSELISTNPYTLEEIQRYPEHTEEEVSKFLEQSHRVFMSNRFEDVKSRSDKMQKASELLKKNAEEYGRLITREMGKPLKESIAEVEKCAWVCSYYAEHAGDFLKSREEKTDAHRSWISYQPLGSILAVMPWNFPFWQVFRFAAPSIMAGNTALLKHASNVQGCAFAIEDIFREAGFSEGSFINLCVKSDRVEKILENPVIRAATLTGSEPAGRAVAGIAGKNLKKTVLELGGNNAFVVLEDADIEEAVSIGVKARMQNGGQSCIAAKRFIVQDKIYDEFLDGVKSAIANISSGDPMNEETGLGPLANKSQSEGVDDQVQRSIKKGASLLTGGVMNHCFYSPTILTDVSPGMPAFDEEVFGPVFAVTKVSTRDEALELSNNSVFGLGLNLFTRSEDNMEFFIERAEEGAVFINSMVKSDPRLPFGGVKNSGYGRELSREGILEFVNAKTVYRA